MKTLILTVGLPRSGKSTWAMKQGVPVVNPDSIRYAIHGQRFLAQAEPLVWATAYTMARALFLAGHETVIVDATNVTQKRRDEWKAQLGSFVDEITVHALLTPAAVCIAQARAEGDEEIIPVIERMAAEWDVLGMTLEDWAVG